MKPLPWMLVAVCLCAVAARAQSGNTGQEDPCSRYEATPLPAEAESGSAPANWPACESYRLYSGIGTAVDYAAARKCAWEERLASGTKIEPERMIDEVIGGSRMLATIYANGDGVEQNKPLALRLACETGMASFGLEAIEALPDEAHVIGKKFSCGDAAYTTIEMNFCAAWLSEVAAKNRQDTLDRISGSWPKADKEAFAALQKAAEDYVEAHGRGEVYQGGTIRGLRTNGVEERQRDKFLAAVQEFESGQRPRGTPADYSKANSDLNATYKKALDLAAKQDFQNDDGAIRPDGIRDAERAWLKYRDAWVAFARVHYPDTDANAWLTLLTTNRVWNLRATMCDVGWGDPACKPR